MRLEDGIGLWEAQGLDDRLTSQECLKLRATDEKRNWNKIPLIDLYKCSSSLSFFDANGMRFHLPVFLLFALGCFKEEEDLFKQEDLDGCSEPDVEFHLMFELNLRNEESATNRKHEKERYASLSINQLNCIKDFFKYRMSELEGYYQTVYTKEFGTSPSSLKYDNNYIQLNRGIEYWENEITFAKKEKTH